MFAALKAKAFAIVGIGSALIIAGLLAWGLRVDHLRAQWKAIAEGVTIALADATDNEKLKPADAKEAVVALAAERDREHDLRWILARRVNAWKAKSDEYQKASIEVRAKADAAIKRKDEAIARLAKATIDPGDRADCVRQIKESDEILLYIFRESE